LRCRLIEHADAEAIRRIYNAEVLESTVTFDLVPRSLDEQLAWIDEHSGGHPAIVAVDDADVVVGFASLSPYRPRPAYAPTVEDSVYVERERRGGHDASIALHRTCGFEEVGREREVGRKLGRWLDVVLMQRML
jgi:L-amino acid N-acyltransferase YncA